MSAVKTFILVSIFVALSLPINADELTLFRGTGPQQHDSTQNNDGWGADYSFYKVVRSERSELSFGIGYTRMTNDSPQNNTLYAISLYPQLTLYPSTKVALNPFFFVRALGPSYISENQFGSRSQDNNFSFQAQVGIGIRPYLTKRQQVKIMFSWKHFSNANLFKNNESFDLPFTLSIGFEW
jgi:hypothetical protein